MDIRATTRRYFQIPRAVDMNGISQPMAFLEGYIWNNVVSVEDLEVSRPLEMTRQAWRDIRSASADACVILAYLPSKETVYLPYVIASDQARIFENPMHLILSDMRFLSVTENPDGDYQGWYDGRYVIRDTIAKYAQMDGLIFVDLTPHFEAEARDGEVLFYVYDTHPNQLGHNLIGAVIADVLAMNPCEETQ